MNCTRQDYELVMEAIRSAIAHGRPSEGGELAHIDGATEQRLIEACGRLSGDPAPALLRAIGNYTLLCLVRSDVAALKARAEIRKLMNR